MYIVWNVPGEAERYRTRFAWRPQAAAALATELRSYGLEATTTPHPAGRLWESRVPGAQVFTITGWANRVY